MQGSENKCPRARAQGSEWRPSGLREKVIKKVRSHAAHAYMRIRACPEAKISRVTQTYFIRRARRPECEILREAESN